MKTLYLGLALSMSVASAACATATAKAPPERPALDVPAPPAKTVEPMPKPESPPDPVPELPPERPTNARPPRAANREAARTDPKPDPATTTETVPAPPPPAVAPAPQLRQPGAAEPSEAAKQVQTLIEHASRSLDSVNTKGFSKARRAVYDNAKGILVQAQEAWKKSDFDNARKLAAKVEDTARELGAGR
jgi:hypothetical protein